MTYYDRFDIVSAHYWWNVEHHSGMSSWGYRRQCHISTYYSPGINANGPESDNAKAIYAQLCEREGCSHE